MTTPTQYRYTKDHEWIDPTKTPWRLGITDFAQKQLGDVVFVEAPKVGTTFATGDELGTIESVKAVSQLFAPVSGKVVAVNDELTSEPELLNTEPYTDGWIADIEPSKQHELDDLMTAADYDKYIASEADH